MKEKSTVFIRIAGTAGMGKTTLAVKIARALKELGVENEVWEYDDSYVQGLSNEEIDRNLKCLSQKIRVVIQTEQMRRHVV